jgi:hypothetical protein
MGIYIYATRARAFMQNNARLMVNWLSKRIDYYYLPHKIDWLAIGFITDWQAKVFNIRFGRFLLELHGVQHYGIWNTPFVSAPLQNFSDIIKSEDNRIIKETMAGDWDVTTTSVQDLTQGLKESGIEVINPYIERQLFYPSPLIRANFEDMKVIIQNEKDDTPNTEKENLHRWVNFEDKKDDPSKSDL